VRASRVLALLVVAVSATTTTACGGDDDGEPLTRAEYELLVRQHREATELTKDPPETTAEMRTYLGAAERQCAQLADSGALLRSVAPSCQDVIDALSSLSAFSARGEACPEDDDGACSFRALEGLVGSFGDLVDSLEESERAVGAADVGSACRAALIGPTDFRASLKAIRDTGRETLAAHRALDDADGDTGAASKRLEQASGRFDAATDAFSKQGDAVAGTDPRPCEADVQEG
jgi:hypothetical protein